VPQTLDWHAVNIHSPHRPEHSHVERILKPFIITVLLAPALVSTTFTQTRKPLPMSNYMRNVGLIYLEAVERLPLNCGDETVCEYRSQWNQNMRELEDRILLTLNESKRPAGDTPYLDLLRTAKYARSMYTIAYSRKDDNRMAWMRAYSACYSEAHTAAMDGQYRGQAKCDAAIEAAIHPQP